MRDLDERDFGPWLFPILLGFMVWGWAIGVGLAFLIGAEDSSHVIVNMLISSLLGLWILRLTDSRTGRQLATVVAVAAGAIAVAVLASVGLLVLFDSAGFRATDTLVRSGARVLAAILCCAVSFYGSKRILNRLGLPLRNPENNPTHP